MAWDDFPKIRGYSLTDFHDFEDCKFKFYVRHHLDKKYEIGKGSAQMALGVLLDKTIKNIHKREAYEYPLKRLLKGVRFSVEQIKEEESKRKRPNFNTAAVEFLNEDVILAAERILETYYLQINGKIKHKIFDIGFYEKILDIRGEKFKLWGGPDTVEMGDDGVPEVCDYKSRQDIAKGKQNMDMDLMPKLYTLLLTDDLLKMGYKKVRFKVVFWQDPIDESFSQIFDLLEMEDIEKIFIDKIEDILKNREVSFCASPYCDACNAVSKEEYIEELKKLGLKINYES